MNDARSVPAAPAPLLQAQYEKVDRRIKAAAIVVLAAVLFFVLPAVDRFVALFMVLAYGRSILRPNEVRTGRTDCRWDGFRAAAGAQQGMASCGCGCIAGTQGMMSYRCAAGCQHCQATRGTLQHEHGINGAVA